MIHKQQKLILLFGGNYILCVCVCPCSASVRAAPAVRGEPPDGLRPDPLRPDGMVRSDPEQPVVSQRHLPAAELHHVSLF